MKLLLTSSGIANPTIRQSLVDLLGKPIEESRALFVPTGLLPFPAHSDSLVRAYRGEAASPLMELGWAWTGSLELTSLPTIRPDAWRATLESVDALLVYGGNVLYLQYWMEVTGLAALLPTLPSLVYVGVSAGSIVTMDRNCDFASNLEHVPANGPVAQGTDRALGWVPAALWVHLNNPNPIFSDHTTDHVSAWASTVDVPTFAIDDESALVVVDGDITVVSEGTWHCFNPPANRERPDQ